jgi:hypothetical protein
VHLLDLDAAEEATLSLELAFPSSTLGVQIFVATMAASRRARRAAPSDASAAPYIGDESKSAVPASRAAPTTSPASRWSPRKVL